MHITATAGTIGRRRKSNEAQDERTCRHRQGASNHYSGLGLLMQGFCEKAGDAN